LELAQVLAPVLVQAKADYFHPAVSSTTDPVQVADRLALGLALGLAPV
jgi:hypothetical protein